MADNHSNTTTTTTSGTGKGFMQGLAPAGYWIGTVLGLAAVVGLVALLVVGGYKLWNYVSPGLSFSNQASVSGVYWTEKTYSGDSDFRKAGHEDEEEEDDVQTPSANSNSIRLGPAVLVDNCTISCNGRPAAKYGKLLTPEACKSWQMATGPKLCMQRRR